jgi:hypothetical protein
MVRNIYRFKVGGEVYQNSTDQSTVFRFKALYTKAVANKELRVFMNDGNQLTAVKTLD